MTRGQWLTAAKESMRPVPGGGRSFGNPAEDEAYEAGRKAAASDATRADNPHVLPTSCRPAAYAWALGFDDECGNQGAHPPQLYSDPVVNFGTWNWSTDEPRDPLREAIVVPENIHPALVARFKDGFMARIRGQDRAANPWSMNADPIKFGAWDLGWMDARSNGSATARRASDACEAAGVFRSDDDGSFEHPATKGTTFDRPDIRNAIIIPDDMIEAGERDAYRDGAVARLDGVPLGDCPYPFPPVAPGVKPDNRLRLAWLTGWEWASIGVKRIGRGKQAKGDNVGRFAPAPEGEATHTLPVSILAMNVKSRPGVLVGVYPVGEFYGATAVYVEDGPYEVTSETWGKIKAATENIGAKPVATKMMHDAVATLEQLGFEYRTGKIGGTPDDRRWQPGPLAKAATEAAFKVYGMPFDPTYTPNLVGVARATRDALKVIAKLGRLPSGGEEIGNWAHVQQLAGDLDRALAGTAATSPALDEMRRAAKRELDRLGYTYDDETGWHAPRPKPLPRNVVVLPLEHNDNLELFYAHDDGEDKMYLTMRDSANPERADVVACRGKVGESVWRAFVELFHAIDAASKK